MKYDLKRQAEQFRRGHTRKNRWRNAVIVLACLTVFITTYALMMPAITMTAEAATDISLANCPLETHVHTSSCYGADGAIRCGYADYVIHRHDEFCYDAEDSMICPLQEMAVHQHSSACYTQAEPVLTCTDNTAEHQHTQDCYTRPDPELSCSSREVIAHEHTAACFTDGVWTCGQLQVCSHQHSEACRATAPAPNEIFNLASIDDPTPADNSGTGTTYNLSQNPTTYRLSPTIKINGESLNSGMTLKTGDAFSFAVDWYLPSDASYTAADCFVYDLPRGVFVLQETTGTLYGETSGADGTKPVYGSYSVSGNRLTVQYTDEFLGRSDKHTTITATGTIDIDDSIAVDEDGYAVVIPGLESVKVRLKTDTGMTIQKNSAKRIVESDSTHETWVDYTITLTANGLNRNVQLTDQFYIDEANPHTIGTTVPVATLTPANGEPSSVSVTTVTNTAIDTTGTAVIVKTNKGDTTSTGAVQSGDPHRTTTAFVPQMSSGDVLMITYSAKLVSEPNAVSHSYYGNAEIHNTVSAESDECTRISDRADDVLRVTYIDKDGGNLSGDATKTYWRIYVCGGEYSTLTIRDILPTNSHLHPTADTVVTVYDATGKSASGVTNPRTTTFGALQTGYEVAFPASGWVMFYYECDADDDCTVTNTAKILETNKTAEYSFSHGNVSATNGTKNWVSAERVTNTMSAGYLSTRILNEINITVGTESRDVSDFYFLDKAEDTSGGAKVHHFPNNPNDTIVSIEVRDPDTNEYSKVTDDRFVISLEKSSGATNNDRLCFRFKDNNVITGTYRIRYYTLVEHEAYNIKNNESHTIKNILYWSDGTGTLKGGGDQQKWVAYSTLWKETKAATTVSNDEIIWKIGSLVLNYSLSDNVTNQSMRYENFRQYSTVVDTLPAGLEFVAAAYGNPNPVQGGEGNVTPTITQNNDGTTTLEFPMYTDTANPQNLYILTKYSGNYESLTEAQEFTNNVQIRLRTEENGVAYAPARMKQSAKATIQPPIIAEKTGKYDTTTVPYAEYTVKINSAEFNLISADADSQTFTLRDTMGSALSLIDTSMLVNGEPLAQHPELTLTVSGGGSSFTLSGLQDQTAYTITYKALVLLSTGSTLNEENAKNMIEIPGITIPEGAKTSVIINGEVVGSSGSAGSTTGYVRVHKVDDRTPAQPVAGAEFTLYRIGTVKDLTGVDSLPTTGTEEATLTTNADGYTDFREVEYGVVYGIRETKVPSGYSDSSNGVMKYFAYQSWEGYTIPAGVQELTGGTAFTFEFTNQASAELTITKLVDGSSATDESFPFTLTSSEAMQSGSGYTLSEDGKTATFSLKNGESVTLTVYTGSAITLTETKHNGYMVLIKEANQQLANGDTASLQISSTDARTVTVHNTPGVLLPSTGGIGTHGITLAGLLCMAFALLVGLRLRRRWERRSE